MKGKFAISEVPFIQRGLLRDLQCLGHSKVMEGWEYLSLKGSRGVELGSDGERSLVAPTVADGVECDDGVGGPDAGRSRHDVDQIVQSDPREKRPWLRHRRDTGPMEADSQYIKVGRRRRMRESSTRAGTFSIWRRESGLGSL